jgi:hypothetical protein
MPTGLFKEMLAKGNVLIADENNNRAIEVNPGKRIVRTLTAGGTSSGVASTVGHLDAPFDAEVVGGYTGLTPSFGFGQPDSQS